MDSSALEVRVIARASAVLIGLIVATLLTTVRLPSAPAPGAGSDFSVQVVRKRAGEMANAAASIGDGARAAAVSQPDGLGVGADIRLWLESPAGELVFVSAERYARCVAARAGRREDADCPSASDRRRMVLDHRSLTDAS
jgi:hypothetical protein